MAKRRVWGYIAFQIGWLSCALGAGNGYPLVGPLVVLLLASVHLFISTDRGREIRALLAIGAVGTLVDSLKAATGLVSYSGGYPGVTWLCPLWITAMWVNYACALNTSLVWLKGRYLLAAVMGAIAGPVNYAAGSRAGAIVLPLDPVVTNATLAAIWGAVVPLTVYVSNRPDGKDPALPAAEEA